MILIRRRAWWYNKVPLSILLFMLLNDGRRLTISAVVALSGLIAVVCCVANYGYALNELFDLGEDFRGGRQNVAAEMSSKAMWAVIVLSASSALVIISALAGTAGFLLTICELLLPLAYSMPPLRVKERGWLGVFADASAAHVYPALIALLIMAKLSLGTYALRFVLTAVAWSLATGLRGILSHQLQSEEHDSAAGLSTVVHLLGHARLRSFAVFVLLPVEVIAFSALLVQSDSRIVFKSTACVFLLYELVKFRLNVFPVIVFAKAGESYIPFVDEGFYKVWGPLAFTIDAALSDPGYLVVVPLYIYSFWARVAQERIQVVQTLKAVSANVRILRREFQ